MQFLGEFLFYSRRLCLFVINDSPAEAQIAVGSGDVDGRHFLGDHILDLFIFFFKRAGIIDCHIYIKKDHIESNLEMVSAAFPVVGRASETALMLQIF